MKDEERTTEDDSYFDRQYFENVQGINPTEEIEFQQEAEFETAEVREQASHADSEKEIDPPRSRSIVLIDTDPEPRWHDESNIPDGETAAEKYAIEVRSKKMINLHLNPDHGFHYQYQRMDVPFWAAKNKPAMYDDDEIDIDKILDEEEHGKVSKDGSYIPPNTTPPFNQMTASEMCHFLKSSIIHNCSDFLAINKPYGLPCQGGEKKMKFDIQSLLPEFARSNGLKELHAVHRLDKNTTGVLLFGKSESATRAVKKLFQERKVEKRYMAITVGVPYPKKGVISDPIQAFYNHKSQISKMFLARQQSSESFNAVTRYEVVHVRGRAALVEVMPETGYRHQIRTHLAQSLGAPILGDHKYSSPTGHTPQTVPPSMLESMNMRSAKTRYIMNHLHAYRMTFPYNSNGGTEIDIMARFHRYYMNNMRFLRLKLPPFLRR